MADEAFESQTRLNRSYSIAAMDEKLQEVTEGISEKFHRMESNMASEINDIRELLLNLQQPSSASPQRSSRAVEEKKFTKQHSLVHPPRQSMHSEQAQDHYEDAIEAKKSTKQHSLVHPRQSVHSGPAQYEDANKTPAKMLSIRLSRQSMLFEANLKHSRQSQDTMQSELPNETTIPVVPLYIGMNIVNKPFISNNFNNKNVSDRMHNDKSLVQYHHNFDNNDEHDECDDDTSECYDLDEIYGNRNEFFEGNSPGYDITNTLYNLDRNTKDMPCFREVRRGKDAKFEEFDHPRSDSTIDQSIAFESSGKTFVNNDDIDDDTNVNDDIGQEYHQYHDDNDVYDTDEILENRHDTIEGDNPYCNVTNTLSYIDKKENKSDKDRPCWMKLQGSRHKHSPHQQHSSLLPIKIYDPGK